MSLPKSDWRRSLHSGDEVKWNDPDGGLCSRTGVIGSIIYEGDCATIVWKDGDVTQVLLEELS